MCEWPVGGTAPIRRSLKFGSNDDDGRRLACGPASAALRERTADHMRWTVPGHKKGGGLLAYMLPEHSRR